jgi:DNA-binding MarR family transcriptional regulator
MEPDIIEALATFGLSETEARLYVFLTGGEAQSVLTIARTLGLPRTNVYDALARLSERGLIERVMRSKSARYRAAPLSLFDAALEERRQHIETMETSLKELKRLMAKTPHKLPSTEIRYYQGVHGMRQLMWNSLKADARGIVGYSVFGRVEVVGLEFYRRYKTSFEKRALTDRAIINPAKETLGRIRANLDPKRHHMQPMHVRMLLVGALEVTGDTMIYNSVYAFCEWRRGEIVGVEIENPSFVSLQRSLFEAQWNIAKPLATR